MADSGGSSSCSCAPWLDQTTFPRTILLLAGLLVWFEEVANVVWSTFNSASANRPAWLLTIYQVLQSLAIVGPALLGIKSLGFYVVAQTIAALIGTLFAVHRLRRQFPFVVDWADIVCTFRNCGAFALSLGLSLVYGRADVAIVAIWLGNVAVGIYSPAVSLVMTALLIPLTIYNVILPLLSRAHAEDRRAFGAFVAGGHGRRCAIGIIDGRNLGTPIPRNCSHYFGRTVSGCGDCSFYSEWRASLSRPFVCFGCAIITAVGWQTQRTLLDQAIAAVMNVVPISFCGPRWGIMGLQRSSC
ncbi:MAG: oligosaccharide flippase family protein [Caldilineaceae bacterium]